MIHMLRRLAGTTVWPYGPATSDATIVCHGRRATCIAGVSMSAGLMMFSSTIEFLLTEPGWWRNLWMVVCIASTAAGMLLIIPGAIAVPWAHEVARECRKRGIDGPDVEALDHIVGITAMKMCGYAAALMVIAVFVARFPTLRPFAATLGAILTVLMLLRAIGVQIRVRGAQPNH